MCEKGTVCVLDEGKCREYCFFLLVDILDDTGPFSKLLNKGLTEGECENGANLLLNPNLLTDFDSKLMVFTRFGFLQNPNA